MTSVINDGGAAVGSVYIHDLVLQPDVAYDEAINFDFNSGSNGTIRNVRIATVDFVNGMRLNGEGWIVDGCYVQADDSAIIIHADATRIIINNLQTGTHSFDDFAIIIHGDENVVTGCTLSGGISVLGNDNLIVGNTILMDTTAINGIRIEGDRNKILSNFVGPGAFTPAVGVDIIAGATDNIIGWNDLSQCTATIADAGTTTTIWDEWVDWTPTYTNLTIGNGTVVARYIQVGKLVECYFSLVFGSTTSISGDVSVSVPLARSASVIDQQIVGAGRLRDASGNAYQATINIRTTGGFRVRTLDVATYVREIVVSSTIPFTWATSDEISFTATYEAA